MINTIRYLPRSKPPVLGENRARLLLIVEVLEEECGSTDLHLALNTLAVNSDAFIGAAESEFGSGKWNVASEVFAVRVGARARCLG